MPPSFFIGRVAAWSCGDYRGLADGARDGPIDWNGELADLQIGADVRLRPDLLAGLAVSRSSGSFRYKAGGGAEARDRAEPRYPGAATGSSVQPSTSTCTVTWRMTALDDRTEHGGFALAACLDRKIAWLTDRGKIGCREWREDRSVFMRRARTWRPETDPRRDRAAN